jgi:hypothetical protein
MRTERDIRRKKKEKQAYLEKEQVIKKNKIEIKRVIG